MSKLRALSALLLGGCLLATLPSCADLDMPGLAAPARLGSASLHTLDVGSIDSSLGLQLADYARSQASGGTGWCYQYVAQAVHAYLPTFLTGMHAYLAADQLAASPYFREVSVPAAELPALPAGAVVVWAKGSSESGHISIADGQGQEISDHIATQMTYHYGGGDYRVFVPAPRS
ncbi:MAG: hypothetical protein ACAI44_29195 [Candidatus Sericytochromatia bacterium]